MSKALSISVLVCICLFWPALVSAQRFQSEMELKFRQSEQQWLVASIEKQSPSLFHHKVNLPETFDTCRHAAWGGHRWSIPNSDVDMFQKLWCPNDHTHRLRKLVSMLDLYGPLLKKSVEQNDLDPMLRWLPLLASGMNQHYTDSIGHRGLWALDYLTARKVGLKINDDFDERCGGDFTTAAVAKYLKEIQTKHNDPLVTVLVYLHGAPQVVEMLPIDYTKLPIDWQRELSFLYYSVQLIEALRLDNYQHHYFDLMGLYAPIRLRDTLDVEALATVLQEDLVALKGMNPVLVGHKMLPGVTKVPYFISTANANRLSQFEDSLYRWKPASKMPETATGIVYHKVKRGESLGSIAKKYRVSVKQIQRANNLKNTKIRPGQVLSIPARGSNDAVQIDREPEANKSPELKSENKPPKETKGKPKETVYVVKNGDSLWKIARKYPGVTEDDIKKWNKCGDAIRPGQKLIIKTKK